MTRSQHRVYNRLRKKQVNHVIDVVEVTERYAVFHVPFPGLYLTYDTVGNLLHTETEAERKAGSRPLFKPGQQPVFTGEMGSDTRGLNEREPAPDLDDDVPF